VKPLGTGRVGVSVATFQASCALENPLPGLPGGWEDGVRITFFLGKRVTQLADVGRFGFQSISVNFKWSVFQLAT
jgi:hypothetical protein